MNKYQAWLDSNQGEESLLNELFAQVEKREFEEAYGTAMRIKAVRDIKWQLKKIDERDVSVH